MNTKEIQNLIKSVGTQEAFARKLGARMGLVISQQAVSQWVQRGSIPVKFCGHIEAMTRKQYPAHVIRPDVFPVPG